MDGIAVAPAVAYVRDEVLRRRDHSRPFELARVEAPHRRREKRVFTVCLLDPPPAHVGRDVHHRREQLPDPARPRLPRDRGRDVAHQPRIERRRQRDRRRKYGGSAPHDPVYAFLERQHRDAEPRRVREVPLQRVVGDGIRPCIRGRPVLQPEDAVRIVVRRVGPAPRQHEELPELLLERHAAEQVVHARFDGE